MRAIRVSSTKSYFQPDAPVWADIKHDDVAMMPTPLAMQPTEYIRKSWEGKAYGAAKSIRVAAVHDGEIWALQASWRGVSAAGKDFPDALAVALPLSGRPALILMGAPNAPIQYLRWQANKDGARSIVATGIGSSRPGAEFKCTAQAKAAGDTWTVVITRPLGHGKEVAPLAAGHKTQIGFAVWLGGNDERAGIKAFSIDWAELALDA